MKYLPEEFSSDDDLAEAVLGKFQVLISTDELVCPEHGVQGAVYYVALPKHDMRIIPVYVMGEQDVHVGHESALLVRFVDVEFFVDDKGTCVQAQYIEVVDAIEEDRYSG